MAKYAATHAIRALLAKGRTAEADQKFTKYRSLLRENSTESPDEPSISDERRVAGNFALQQERDALRQRASSYRETAKAYHPTAGRLLIEEAIEFERQAASLDMKALGRNGLAFVRH